MIVDKSRNRMSMLGGLHNKDNSGVADSSIGHVSEDMMEMGIGCATMQGLELDNWLQNKVPSSQILEMFPSTRYPSDQSGHVVKRMSMLSQLSGGLFLKCLQLHNFSSHINLGRLSC